MTKSFTNLFTGLLVVLSWCSCMPLEGNGPGPTRSMRVEVTNVALKFGFNNFFDKEKVRYNLAGDYQELCTYYNLTPNNDYTGEITELFYLLANEGKYDDDHKPSVTLIAETPFLIDTIHLRPDNFRVNNEVVLDDSFDTTTKGSVTVKSPKTRDYGVRVVWEKIFTENNWPIKEFVAECDTITSDYDSYLKVGTNNDRGDVATRNGGIITNTYDDIGDALDESHGPIVYADDGDNSSDLKGIKEENVFLPPLLEKAPLVGGSVSKSYKWSTPTIYRVLQ